MGSPSRFVADDVHKAHSMNHLGAAMIATLHHLWRRTCATLDLAFMFWEPERLWEQLPLEQQ
jgi:hypothetical protein